MINKKKCGFIAILLAAVLAWNIACASVIPLAAPLAEIGLNQVQILSENDGILPIQRTAVAGESEENHFVP